MKNPFFPVFNVVVKRPFDPSERDSTRVSHLTGITNDNTKIRGFLRFFCLILGKILIFCPIKDEQEKEGGTE